MLTKMIIVTLLFFCLFALNGYAAEYKKQAECRVVIAADLHFDMPPETDQFHHVLAINALGDTMRIDGVILAGDLFDKSDPRILDLYRQRWERGPAYKQIHYDVYPCFGNHDVSPGSGRPDTDRLGMEFNLHYLDSTLLDMKSRKQIVNRHASSRSYSFNLGGAHFICAQLCAGDTSYCESNMEWIADDLRRYASDGTPVVFIQHYGFDKWALEWWSEESRERLVDMLGNYNLAAFFVGHTHESSVQEYKGMRVCQVNNAWNDDDGPASFAVLHIKGKNVTVDTYEVLDDKGTTRLVKPSLCMKVPINK